MQGMQQGLVHVGGQGIALHPETHWQHEFNAHLTQLHALGQHVLIQGGGLQHDDLMGQGQDLGQLLDFLLPLSLGTRQRGRPQGESLGQVLIRLGMHTARGDGPLTMVLWKLWERHGSLQK